MASALVWSVAPVLFKYEHSLRPPLACFSHARHPEMTPAEAADRRRARRCAARARLPRGDFVLRSGRRSATTSTSTASKPGRTLLGPLGERIARACRARARGRPARGPELGAGTGWRRRLARLGPALLIVRKEPRSTAPATASKAFEEGECVCLVEDVVTSGGAAVAAIEALREAADLPYGRLRRRS